MHRHRFEALDGLRGMVALGVLLFHAGDYFGLPDLVPHAFLGVDFFFVLSGVVIGQAYERKLATRAMSVADFVKTRVIRLYPLAALGTLLGFLFLYPASYGRELAHGLAFIPMIRNAPGKVIFPLDVVLWSLFFELVVNVLYALAAPWLSSRRLCAIAAVCLAIFALHGEVNAGFWSYDLQWALPRTVFSFCVGLLIQRRHAAGTLPAVRAPAWALAGLFGLVLAAPYPSGWRDVCDLALLATVPPLIVTAGLSWRPKRRLLKLSRLAGELSYPVYALHVPIMLEIVKFRPLLAAPWPVRLAAVGGVALLACGVAWAALRLVDAPVRRRLTTWLGARPRPAVVLAGE